MSGFGRCAPAGSSGSAPRTWGHRATPPAQRPVAETVVYLRGPGTVVCCRNCPGMLMVISLIRGVNCADLGGLTALDPAGVTDLSG
jgi:Family of unknown function (DUF6510)